MMPEVSVKKTVKTLKHGGQLIRVQLFPARFAIHLGQDLWEVRPDFLNRLENQVKMAEQAGLKVVISLNPKVWWASD